MSSGPLAGIIRGYARVIVRTGVAVQKGQRVRISTEVVNSGFARMLAEEAYLCGASLVDVAYVDVPLERIRLDHTADAASLSTVPRWHESMYEAVLDGDWAAIALRGPEDPDALEGVDAGRLGSLRAAVAASRRAFSEGIASNRIAWNVCLWPTPKWSAKVLEAESGDWEERIWDILTPILRLSSADPAGAWLEHDRELKRRAGYLQGKKFSAFRFTGPGTDLTVTMKPDRIWTGGSCVNAAGTRFFPNIPTEEVFSTPDRNGTEGTVRCTRPVEVLGSRVDGAWLRFEGGRVTGHGADTNGDVLSRFLEIEDAAGYLGEIALVGTDSPIYGSGILFHNTLFDENASCHIALGNGYRDCIEGGTRMDSGELERTGCNTSLVHIDFMIGSSEVSVFGIDGSGKSEPVITDGRFVI